MNFEFDDEFTGYLPSKFNQTNNNGVSPWSSDIPQEFKSLQLEQLNRPLNKNIIIRNQPKLQNIQRPSILLKKTSISEVKSKQDIHQMVNKHNSDTKIPKQIPQIPGMDSSLLSLQLEKSIMKVNNKCYGSMKSMNRHSVSQQSDVENAKTYSIQFQKTKQQSVHSIQNHRAELILQKFLKKKENSNFLTKQINQKSMIEKLRRSLEIPQIREQKYKVTVSNYVKTNLKLPMDSKIFQIQSQLQKFHLVKI